MAAEHLSPLALKPGPALAAGFTDALFGHLDRADQRHWARAYLCGLLSAQGRKSVRRIAIGAAGHGSSADSLRRFVNTSPWDWGPSRRGLARWVEERADVRAWTLELVILPKRGAHSCGVHRRFVPELGRLVNCQAALGLFLSTPAADYPVDWQLVLPDLWVSDARLRARARIPESVTRQSLSQQALSLIETAAAGTAKAPVPVVADFADLSQPPDIRDATLLVDGLDRAGIGFVLAMPEDWPVLPAADGEEAPAPGSQPRRPGRSTPKLDGGDGKGKRPSRPATRFRQAYVPGVQTEFQAFAAPALPPGPRRLMLTNLDSGPAERIAELGRARRGTGPAVSELALEHGLHDFEGRSFPGWHHHMTLVSAAHSYRRLAGSAAGSARPDSGRRG